MPETKARVLAAKRGYYSMTAALGVCLRGKRRTSAARQFFERWFVMLWCPGWKFASVNGSRWPLCRPLSVIWEGNICLLSRVCEKARTPMVKTYFSLVTDAEVLGHCQLRFAPVSARMAASIRIRYDQQLARTLGHDIVKFLQQCSGNVLRLKPIPPLLQIEARAKIIPMGGLMSDVGIWTTCCNEIRQLGCIVQFLSKRTCHIV